MTLKVWIFCLLLSTGAFLGSLVLEFQTTMLWKHAMGQAIFFLLGSVVTAFYFTRPGFSKRLQRS
jgi:hypothetical protein